MTASDKRSSLLWFRATLLKSVLYRPLELGYVSTCLAVYLLGLVLGGDICQAPK
jgi:hypothetical protein